MADAGTESTEQLILLELDGPTATLTLNRPDKLNALVPDTFVRLRELLGQLAANPDIGCLVLQGAGRAFCAGHDLEAIGLGDEEQHHQFEAETVDLLESFPHPTIAKIHGYCLTGGLELALGCDVLVCADETKIGDTHGKWGLVPVWGNSIRLPERVGLAMAKQLSFTSRIIDGRRAAEIGLVNASVPANSLNDEVATLAGEIAANSTEANRIMKLLYRNSLNADRQERLDFERIHGFGTASDAEERVLTGTRKL